MTKGCVLVHCHAGVSRSATVVIAYLMQEKDLTFDQAFSFASKKRPVIFPNMGFQRQLQEWERLLALRTQTGTKSKSQQNGRPKKKNDNSLDYSRRSPNLDISNAFSKHDLKLGQMAELNKKQVENAV